MIPNIIMLLSEKDIELIRNALLVIDNVLSIENDDEIPINFSGVFL